MHGVIYSLLLLYIFHAPIYTDRERKMKRGGKMKRERETDKRTDRDTETDRNRGK